MSRVLRQIFKKIFCGDLFRPVAIFFCAPAAALSPSCTVCASSFPYRLPVPSSCPFPPFCTRAPPLPTSPLHVLSFPVPFVSFCGQALYKCPFSPSRAPAPFSCHARTRPARILITSPMLFFILSRARTPCAFFYCCANISRARSYSVVRRHAADNMITRTCPARFYSVFSRYAPKDLTTRLRPARLKREGAPERGALSSYR